jgi:hypothetical protein
VVVQIACPVVAVLGPGPVAEQHRDRREHLHPPRRGRTPRSGREGSQQLSSISRKTLPSTIIRAWQGAWCSSDTQRPGP